VLRLAFYQAANGPTARRVDPQLAAYYQHLMVERGHCHTQASVAIARKLAERIWTVLTRGQPYQYRDATGQAVTRMVAKDQARHDHAVPDHVRARARARSAAHTSLQTHQVHPLRDSPGRWSGRFVMPTNRRPSNLTTCCGGGLVDRSTLRQRCRGRAARRRPPARDPARDR